jgi:hypothetical protein
MKAKVEVNRGSYGFGYTWTLILSGKSKEKRMFLGQDNKVCSRLLQCSPSYIVEQIGTRDIESEQGSKKLAKFILETLKENHLLSTRKIMSMESWDLCVE